MFTHFPIENMKVNGEKIFEGCDVVERAVIETENFGFMVMVEFASIADCQRFRNKWKIGLFNVLDLIDNCDNTIVASHLNCFNNAASFSVWRLTI